MTAHHRSAEPKRPKIVQINSEVKALATGDPRILEKAHVDTELTRLERLERAHARNQRVLSSIISQAENALPSLDAERQHVEAALARTVDTSGDKFTITIAGTRWTSRVDAAAALRDVLAAIPAGEHVAVRPIPVATLAGFDITATAHRYLQPHLVLELIDVPRSGITIDLAELRVDRPLGIITKLENRAGGLDRILARISAEHAALTAEADRARSDYGQPFTHAAALAAAGARSAELDAELSAPAETPPGDSRDPGPTAITPTPRPAKVTPSQPITEAVRRPTPPPPSNTPLRQLAASSSGAPPGGWTDADQIPPPAATDRSHYQSAQHYPIGTQLTVHAIGENGPGRRLGHGVVVDHPSPTHVTVESPYGTKRVAPISHVSTNRTPADGHLDTPDATLPQPDPATTRWGAVCDRLDPRITADPHWPTLAAQLERAAADGTDVESLLRQVTRDTALPPDHPARSLGYCIASAAPAATAGALNRPHPGGADQSPAARSIPEPPAASTVDGYRPGPRR